MYQHPWKSWKSHPASMNSLKKWLISQFLVNSQLFYWKIQFFLWKSMRILSFTDGFPSFWYTSMCQSPVSPFSLPASPQNIARRLIMIFSIKVAINWCIHFGKIVYCNEIKHSNWVRLKTGYPSTHCFIIIFPVIHGYFGGYTAFSHTQLHYSWVGSQLLS